MLGIEDGPVRGGDVGAGYQAIAVLSCDSQGCLEFSQQPCGEI